MPVGTNGCLSFCVCCCFFVYSSIDYVGIIPLFNEINYWAGAGRRTINTRSTSIFGSFLMMFRHKGKNKNQSTEVRRLLEHLTFYSSQLSDEERVSASLEAKDEFIYIH